MTLSVGLLPTSAIFLSARIVHAAISAHTGYIHMPRFAWFVSVLQPRASPKLRHERSRIPLSLPDLAQASQDYNFTCGNFLDRPLFHTHQVLAR